MDFSTDPRLDQLRRDFRRWLSSNLPAPAERRDRRGLAAGERLPFLRDWQRRLAAERWLVVHWPRAYGGRGGSILEHLVITEELVRHDAPPLINGPSLSIFGPTLLACGTEEQRRRFLPPLVAAEEIWCLGFSEPDAGSDLAALRTRAERRGDHWAVTGQKVWSTYAHEADWCLVLARTDPDVPKHRGISCLLVPMNAAGITVRPLREMTGDCDFNEVFFEDVRIPLDHVVGGVNEGWQVILTALGHERGTLLLVDHVRHQRRLEQLVAASRRRQDRVARQRLAALATDVHIMKLHGYKVLGDLEAARPSTDVSVLKLFGSELVQRLTEAGLSTEGPFAQLWHEGDAGAGWQRDWLMARALTIASGTSEVQRSIIAERLLGLPRGR